MTLIAWTNLRHGMRRAMDHHIPSPTLAIKGSTDLAAWLTLLVLGIDDPDILTHALRGAATTLGSTVAEQRFTDHFDDACLMVAAGFTPHEIGDALVAPQVIPDRATLLTMTGLRNVRIVGLSQPMDPAETATSTNTGNRRNGTGASHR